MSTVEKQAWTPGPWRVDPRYVNDVQTADGKLEICTLLYAGNKPAVKQQDANARLIAQAPAMAKLLIESTESIGGDWRERRDAVLKAAGAL